MESHSLNAHASREISAMLAKDQLSSAPASRREETSALVEDQPLSAPASRRSNSSSTSQRENADATSNTTNGTPAHPPLPPPLPMMSASHSGDTPPRSSTFATYAKDQPATAPAEDSESFTC